MESVEDPPHPNSNTDVAKGIIFEDSVQSAVVVEVDKCHKSNGVVESVDAGHSEELHAENVSESVITEEIIPGVESNSKDDEEGTHSELTATQSTSEVVIEEISEEIAPNASDNKDISADGTSGIVEDEPVVSMEPDKNIEGQVNECIIQSNDVEVISETVTFETEVLVESNINEINENDVKAEDSDPNTHILNELGQNIELSEALRSPDVADAVENNNCAPKQEMFNKEELLNILEGNDVAESIVFDHPQGTPTTKHLEAQLALQQLSRLKERRKKRKRNESLQKIPRKSREVQIVTQDGDDSEVVVDIALEVTQDDTQDEISEKNKQNETIKKVPRKRKELKIQQVSDKADENTQNAPEITPEVAPEVIQAVIPEVANEANIVNVLVKDWDDEDPMEEELTTVTVENQQSLDVPEKSEKTQENDIKPDETVVRTSIDSSTSDGQVSNLSKGTEEGQPQKRLGRVIKKKVIFDPDNPDTFTKNKSGNKSKEVSVEKEQLQTPNKKIRIEHAIQRSKSKSPISKLQWKKPSPKNSKQNKRLTEVDKLLMDEGAVNMIYQLTPEAPKGRKNMKTKAEFIKKIQSSTPDSKEMKFRERKKEAKEEGEARKILGGKQRPSLNSSVKSSPAFEDFEAHSADDSIIYRRHSSSSYSSSCMSPRRLSDVEGSQATLRHPESQGQISLETSNSSNTDVFMADPSSNAAVEVINKNDCLSIKEKLNSKLSLALNKRKREGTRLEKPPKTKKIVKTDETLVDNNDGLSGFKHLSIHLDGALGEICIRKSGSIYTIEVMKELEKALSYINLNEAISVTLLNSECGTLCSGLDLKPLLSENSEEQLKNARELAECVRAVVCAVRAHNKVVVGGSSGGANLAITLLGACDIALGSEGVTYSLSAPSMPAAAAILSQRLPGALLNEMMVGRVLSASEAVQAGLVSRVLWPHRFPEQLRAIAKDIAAQPPQAVLMKKKLMQLSRSDDESFVRTMEKERDLFVEYWSSAAGREDIRAALALYTVQPAT